MIKQGWKSFLSRTSSLANQANSSSRWTTSSRWALSYQTRAAMRSLRGSSMWALAMRVGTHQSSSLPPKKVMENWLSSRSPLRPVQICLCRQTMIEWCLPVNALGLPSRIQRGPRKMMVGPVSHPSIKHLLIAPYKSLINNRIKIGARFNLNKNFRVETN